MTTINHLGPYDVSDVTDAILGDVVYNQEVPIIIKQTINNETTFAVLATRIEMCAFLVLDVSKPI